MSKKNKGTITLKIDLYSIGRLFLFLVAIGLSILNLIGIIKLWKLLDIQFERFTDLLIIPNLLLEYVLIGLTSIFLVALIKGGFDKIKSYEDEGLICGLIFELICGLIFGLIFGLIGGLIFGLIGGLIGGLIAGLIVGLIFGLIEEFAGYEK